MKSDKVNWQRGDIGYGKYHHTGMWCKIRIKRLTHSINIVLPAICDGALEKGKCSAKIKEGALHGVDYAGGRYCLKCCYKEKPCQP